MKKPASRRKSRVYCARFKTVRGKRKCASYSRRGTRHRKKDLKRVARNRRVRKANAEYEKMSTPQKAAYLKRKLPGMEHLIDAHPEFYGYRR